jgi:5-methylcytosine-specific restriction endonuclease McrA
VSATDNLQGKRFGRLVVLEEIPNDLYENSRWKVQCDCGKTIELSGRALIYRKTTHCGCQRTEALTRNGFYAVTSDSRVKDESGKTYGSLLVLKATKKNAKGERYWLCYCSCGNYTEVRGSHLRAGTVQSCGCNMRKRASERAIKHGLTYTREYVRSRSRKRERAAAKLDVHWTGEMEYRLRQLFPRCVLCGISEEEHQLKWGTALHVDHVRPLSKGHPLAPYNAVVLCRVCNAAKFTKDLEALHLPDASVIQASAALFGLVWNSGD